jgi:catechol 2,3-dioxygenase-like lactoylglutathione lyase family enzyme
VLKVAIPVLHVRSSRRAEEFYCGKLGFTLDWANRAFGGDDPCYMGVTRDGAHFHLSSYSGDGVSGNVVMIEVEDVDALFAELSSHGVAFDPVPVDQTWGQREMYAVDPDGNTVRFFCEIG